MGKLQLSLALVANDRSLPIINRKAVPEGIDLNITVSQAPGEIFWRQLHFQEFDIAEMSFSDTLMLISRGNRDWVMLPVFMTRSFFHTSVLVRADAGIDKMSDLRGKRVGLQEYVQTAHVWTRGILNEEFGVSADEILWHQERPEAISHFHLFGMKPAPKHFQFIPAEKTVGGMMLAGELDAVLHYSGKPNLLDRSSVNLREHPSIRPLFPKARAEQIRYHKKTGIFPVNHAPVIRRSIVERHPWVALNLYQAFLAAKQQHIARVKEHADVYTSLGWLDADARGVLDRDPFPYGISENRKTLETCARYSLEQGLSTRPVALDEVFAEPTMAF